MYKASLALDFRQFPWKAIASAITVLAFVLNAASPGLALAQAEWTVLVYMNGKNNLEPFALTNFHDIAEVGSTADVNIVVEMGRPSTVRYTAEDGNWSGVLRFLVKRDSKPIPQEAIVDVAKIGESTDMGKPEALRQFIRWSKDKYPAKKYMLIIWNHGQGWRFQVASTLEAKMRASSGRIMAAADSVVKSGQPLPAVGGYRAVSSDDDTRSLLFNRDIQDVLSEEFGGQQRLDLLGFDACLMGMLETAYGFAPYVRNMLASEELEEGEGWHYAPWLRFLTQNPGATSEALSTAVVDAYAKRYGNSYLTTLSVVRLDGIRQVAGKLSSFAREVSGKAAVEAPFLLNARNSLTAYGASVHPPLHTSIDLIALLEQYEKRTRDVDLKNLSAALRKDIASQVLVNYASRRSSDPATDGLPYGSRGIAIYFPSSKFEFSSDPYHDGYLKANTYKPVDFVRNELWADLLYRVLGIP